MKPFWVEALRTKEDHNRSYYTGATIATGEHCVREEQVMTSSWCQRTNVEIPVVGSHEKMALKHELYGFNHDKTTTADAYPSCPHNISARKVAQKFSSSSFTRFMETNFKPPPPSATLGG